MQLVLTNDDGYDAPGLAALKQAAEGLGDILTVAPLTPQSFMGHRVTTLDPLTLSGSGDEFQVDGTPADCARIALSCLAPKTDWLLSGINRGANLGADTYISGTVAAAREAALLGYRSIALSQYVAKGREVDWSLTASHAAFVLRLLFERELPPGLFWNVNLPHPEPGDRSEKQIVFCPMDFHPLDVQYRREGNQFRYAGFYHSRLRRPGTDVDLCFSGHIAVTAMPLDICAGCATT